VLAVDVAVVVYYCMDDYDIHVVDVLVDVDTHDGVLIYNVMMMR